MKIAVFSLAVVASGLLNAIASAADERVYEMRVYYAAPGKLDALHSRFRDHTCKLFEKHGMTNVGYFTPIDNPEFKLIYFLAHESRGKADVSWKEFLADPDWKKAHAASEQDGKLVAKIESSFMKATDYSPELKIDAPGNRVFELRTYTASPNNLGNLNDRFKNHTIELFAKHGMTNVEYWNLLPGEKGAENTLVYVLAHKSVDAAKASFGAFGKDPVWQAARKASEEKGGGSLTVPKGVVSVFLVPTDYSPMK